MSRFIAQHPQLWHRTKWCGGILAGLAALLLLVLEGWSDAPPANAQALAAPAPGAAFQILAPPARQPNGSWRITWSSEPGLSYQLQRTANDDLTSSNWVDVATVVAPGLITSFDDATAAPAGRRFYRLRRVDVPVTSYALNDPDFFVPLGPGGEPVEGTAVAVAADGLMAALEMRPGGRHPAGQRQGFFLRFPNGARLVTNGAIQELEFTSVEAGFGPDSFVQLAAPLRWTGSPARRLPARSPDVASLARAFGLDPALGLELRLFGRLPVTWLGGVLADDGIRGARFSLGQLPRLPLPASSGTYPEFTFDLTAKDGLRLPFAGDFTLPDSTGHPPRLSIPSHRPLWITLRPDGHIAMEGRGELSFPDGPKFSVDFGFDDPHYHLRMAAAGVHLPLLGQLSPLLPGSPAACLPAAPDAAQLARASACLRHFANAFLQFSATVVGAGPAEGAPTPDAPPQAVNPAVSILESWRSSALAAVPLPLDQLRPALQQLTNAAVATRDFNALCDQYATLLRLELARHTGALQAGAPDAALLADAIKIVVTAVIRRADEPESIVTLRNMEATARCLLEIQTILQSVGIPLDPPLASALQRLVRRFAARTTAELGVVPGTFTPTPGSRLAGLDRFEVFETLVHLTEVMRLAQSLGIDAELNAPLPEAIGQLALRLWSILGARLLAAEADHDYPAFTYALEDALELIQLRETGLLPDHPDLNTLPGPDAKSTLAARLGQVFALDPSQAGGQRSLENQGAELRRLIRILREVPANVTLPAPPLQRAYDRLDAALGRAVNTLNLQSQVKPVVDLLDAGIAHAALRDRFQLTVTPGAAGAPLFNPAAPAPDTAWESTRLPATIARLLAVAPAKRDWSQLHRAAILALDEADRRGTINDQPRRLLYLQAASQLLQAAHGVATDLWNDTRLRLERNPGLFLADLLLPGDLRIDELAGAIRYNRQQRTLDGSLSGRLRLPKFGATLAVPNASLGSGGAFDLAAHGTLQLPQANNADATLTIPARRPLHISCQPGGPLRLGGEGRVALRNGMSFGAHFLVDDPAYEFGLEAGGLRLNLARQLTLQRPVLPDPAQLSPPVVRAFNRFYQGLNASLDALSPLAEPLAVGQPGDPPAFQDVPVTPLGAGVAAAAAKFQAQLATGLLQDFDATAASLRDQFRQLADGLPSIDSRAALASEIRSRSEALVALCDALTGEDPNRAEATLKSAEGRALVEALLDASTRLLAVEAGRSDAPFDDTAAGIDQVISLVDCASLSGLSTRVASTRSAFEAFRARARQGILRSLGFDPATGLPDGSDPNPLASRSDEQLVDALIRLRDLTYALNSSDAVRVIPAPEKAALTTILLTHRDRTVRALRGMTTADPITLQSLGLVGSGQQAFQNLVLLYGITYAGVTVERFAGGTGPAASLESDVTQNLSGPSTALASQFEAIGVAQAHATVAALHGSTAADQWARDPLGDEAAFERFSSRTGNPPARRTFPGQVAFLPGWLDDIRRDLQGRASSTQLEAGDALLARLVSLARIAQRHDPPSLQPIADLIRTDLTPRLIVPARAQKTTWLLNRHIALLADAAEERIDGAPIAIRSALLASAAEALAACGDVTDLLDALRPSFEPVELSLPGALLIRRVAGTVRYRRDTGLLSGTFRGRLEFPDLQNAWFEVVEATLNSALEFSFQARTAGPLPFEGTTLEGAVQASGGPGQPLQFAGSGTLLVRNGPTLDATFQWDGATRTFTADSQAGGLQSLRFTDNLVLFDAGLGFTLRPGLPGGELRANGSAGFFAAGPLPATGPLTREQFRLFAENVRAALRYEPGRVDLTFSNGTLHLPPFFQPSNLDELCPPPAGPNPIPAGPSVVLHPAEPIRATFRESPAPGAPPSLSLDGALEFRRFAIAPPGLTNFAAAICSATLRFQSGSLPVLTNVSGSLQIPIPNQTAIIDLTDGVVSLTGYPSGRLELRRDLTLLNLDGFRFVLLGQGHPECPAGSGLTVFPTAGFNDAPAFQLDGGVRVIAPVSMLTGENGDEASGLACGSLMIAPGQPPALDLQALQFGGTFHLGSGGPVVRQGLISFEGIPNLFQLDAAHPFVARLQGTLEIPSGPALTLQDARFTFFDPNRLPRFSVAGIGVNNEQFTLMNSLPVRVTRAEMQFKAPLAELPGLLAPTNVNVLLSAAITLPSADTPMLAGAVDQLRVDFDANGIPRVQNLDGFELGLTALKLPPLRELGGRLRVGGLSAGDPARVYLVGRVGGSYQGYQVIGQFAATPSGPLGFCLEVNAGAAGIPIGPTGILITGASGGESFVNNNGDPCDFTTYFSRAPDGSLVAPSSPLPPGLGLTWDAFRDIVNRLEAQAQIFADQLPNSLGGGAFAPAGGIPPGANAAAPAPAPAQGGGSSGELECPGNCPPATVNIFCQPHPDQDRYPGKIIAKFSSLDEPTLNSLGITRASIQALGGNLASIAQDAARRVRQHVATVTPPPDPQLLGPEVANALANVIQSSLDTLESAFSNLTWQALGSPQAGEGAYETIRRLAYEGLPCADVTMSVAGNVSYAGISTMAYISGRGILSTAGAGGVVGTVHVLGVPLGQARVFIAATDERGDPNPSICGEALVSFGPVELGQLKLRYACPGCVTGVLGGIPEMLNALSDPLLARLAARIQTNSTLASLPRAQLIPALLALPPTQRLGVFAELASTPLSDLPANLPQVFFQGIADLYDSIQPEFVACGQVAPKVFGLPLGDALVEGQLFATKTEVAGGFAFSPSYLFSTFLPILPGSDSAALSFSYNVPDPAAFLFGGLAGSFAPDRLAAYTQSAIDTMLQNSAFAVSYEIHPLGLSMGAAAGRVILPDLTTHPTLPWSSWVRPEDRGIPSLPSRHDLLLQALAANKLGDAVNWRGTTADLASVYPAGSPERAALAGLSLSKDYFPHGGVLGAARLTLPALLTDRPPVATLQLVLNDQADPATRLTAAIDLIQNYLLRFNTNGALGFYVPAPNPPAFFDLNGQLAGQAQLQAIAASAKPQDILASIRSFNPAQLRLGQLYPVEQAFLRGYLQGELLGVPIIDATAIGLPADATRAEGFLSVTSAIPASSWLRQFIPQASLIFDVRGLPPAPLEDRFADLLRRLQAARAAGASNAELLALVQESASALASGLPKVRLTADLQAGLHMPAPMSDLLDFSGSARLHGFSPRYEPGYAPLDDSPFAQARRNGGLAFEGALRVRAAGATLVDVADAQLSVIPRDQGPPALSGRLAAAVLPWDVLTFRDVLIEIANEPAPRFTAAGALDPLYAGSFVLGGPAAPTAFRGRLEAAREPNGTTTFAAWMGPTRLTLPSLFPGTDTLTLHGPTLAEPFKFATASPWDARATVSSQLTLSAGGIDLLRFASADFASLRLAGTNGLSDVVLEGALKPGLTLTVFPGQGPGIQQTLVLSGLGAQLRVQRDGSFELTGALGAALNVTGQAFTQVAGGAAFRLTSDGLTLTAAAGQLVGGALIGVPANGASGTITFGRDRTVTVAGIVTVNPFATGQFRLESIAGGANPIAARIENGGLFLTGAQLAYRGTTLAVLPEITVLDTGDFTVSVGTPVPLTVALSPYTLNNATFTLRRSGGALMVPAFTGTLSLPRLNRSATLSGSLGAAGTFTLSGTLAGAVGLSGLPVATLNAGAQVTFTESRLSVTGSLSGGALAQFTPVGATTGRLDLTQSTLTVSGVITVQPLTLGVFTLESPAGGAFSVHFANTSLTLSNLQVRVASLLSAPLAVPTLPMAADGGFVHEIIPSPGPASRAIAGFSVSISRFTLRREAGVMSIDPITATLALPGFSQTLTGALRSDGQAALDYNNTLTLAGGWSLANGTLRLRNSGLTANGTLSIPGFAPLTLDGSILPAGAWSLSQSFANQSFHGFPALNASYTLSANAGQLGTLTNALQLDLPGLATARFRGALSANGTFSLEALDQSVTLAGFGLTDADLTLARPVANGAVTLTAAASLNVPGFGTPLTQRLGGTISAGGSPNLSWGGTLALGGFTLGSGSLTLNDAGLAAQGTIPIAGLDTLSFQGEIQPSGAFSLRESRSSQGFFGFPAQNVVHTFSAVPGAQAAISTRFNLAFGEINALTFEGSLATSGAAQIRAGARSWSLGGIAITNLSLAFQHNAGAQFATLSASASLIIPDFSQSISGSFGPDGSHSLRYSGGLTMGSFFAGNGSLTLTNVAPRLRAAGSFDIRIGTRTYNSSLALSGGVDPGGNYSLTPSATPWSLSFSNDLDQALSGFASDRGAALTLKRSGIDASGFFELGLLRVPVRFPAFTSNGIQMTGGTNVESGWIKVFGNPFGNTPGDVWTRASGSVAVSESSGRAKIGFSGDFGIYEFFSGLGGPDANSWSRAAIRVGSAGTVNSGGRWTKDYGWSNTFGTFTRQFWDFDF